MNNLDKGLWTLLILIFFIACKQEQAETIIEQELVNKQKKEISQNCNLLSNYQNGATFIKLKQLDTLEYKLVWGNNDFQREIDDTFYCKQISDSERCDFTPELIEFTSNYIFLKSVFVTPSAGNCSPLTYQFWQLPLNNDEKVYSKTGFIQKSKEYLVFNNDEKSLLIRNLKTKNEQIIKLTPKPYIEFKTLEHSIDTIIINKKMLSVTYLIGTHQDYKKMTQSFKINI